MTDSWKVYPLYFGGLPNFERSLLVLHKGYGEKIGIVCIGWLLDNGREKILVDTGPWDPVNTKKYHHYDSVDTGPESVSKALRGHGLGPGDVDTVLLTHLHWDHTSNVDMFTEATFYVQRSEVSYGLDPLPTHRAAYEVGLDFEPPWQRILDRTSMLDGDAEIRPGVICCHLPGHTPGSQGVLVDTEAGKYLIAGDNVDLQENWDGDEQYEHRPGGIFTNLEDYWESIARMEELADFVLPAHDPRVFEREKYP